MSDASPARRRSWRSKPLFVIATVCLVVFNDQMPARMLVPVLPSELVMEGGVSAKDVSSWSSLIVAGYGLVFLIVSPLVGRLSEHWSRRTVLLLSLPIWAVGLCIMMFFGWSPYALVAARAVQGLASAAVGVCALALLIDAVGASKAAVGMSSFQVSSNLTAAFGPILAGTIFDKFGWKAVWVLPLILTVLAGIFLLFVKEKPEKFSDKDEPIDEESDDEDRFIGKYMKSSTSLPGTIERTPLLRRITGRGDLHDVKPQPGSIMDLLRHSRVIIAMIANLLCLSLFMAMDTILPIFLYVSWSWSTSETGLLFLACSAPKALSPLTAKLLDRYGVRYPTAIAYVMSAAGFASMRFVEKDTTRDIALLISMMCLTNVAISTAQLGMMAEIGVVALEIKAETGKDLAAQGGALISLSSTLGFVVGPLFAGLIYSYCGWKTFTLALAIICGLLSPSTLLFQDRF